MFLLNSKQSSTKKKKPTFTASVYMKARCFSCSSSSTTDPCIHWLCWRIVVLLCRPPKVEMRLRGREMRLWKFELCFQQPLLRTTLGDDHLKAQAHCVPLHRDSASAERERYWQSFSEESEHVFFYCVVSTDVVVFLLAVKLISIHQRIAVLFHDGNGNSPT